MGLVYLGKIVTVEKQSMMLILYFSSPPPPQPHFFAIDPNFPQCLFITY